MGLKAKTPTLIVGDRGTGRTTKLVELAAAAAQERCGRALIFTGTTSAADHLRSLAADLGFNGLVLAEVLRPDRGAARFKRLAAVGFDDPALGWVQASQAAGVDVDFVALCTPGPLRVIAPDWPVSTTEYRVVFDQGPDGPIEHMRPTADPEAVAMYRVVVECNAADLGLRLQSRRITEWEDET